jgi:hypothetical protein
MLSRSRDTDLGVVHLGSTAWRAPFRGTAPDLRVDGGQVPATSGSQPAFDKVGLSQQRLQVHGERGQTVEPPGTATPARQAVIVVVKTTWTVTPESPRRARLLAAMFGTDTGGL